MQSIQQIVHAIRRQLNSFFGEINKNYFFFFFTFTYLLRRTKLLVYFVEGENMVSDSNSIQFLVLFSEFWMRLYTALGILHFEMLDAHQIARICFRRPKNEVVNFHSNVWNGPIKNNFRMRERVSNKIFNAIKKEWKQKKREQNLLSERAKNENVQANYYLSSFGCRVDPLRFVTLCSAAAAVLYRANASFFFFLRNKLAI